MKKLSSSVCDSQGFPVIIPDSETSRILGDGDSGTEIRDSIQGGD